MNTVLMPYNLLANINGTARLAPVEVPNRPALTQNKQSFEEVHMPSITFVPLASLPIDHFFSKQ